MRINSLFMQRLLYSKAVSLHHLHLSETQRQMGVGELLCSEEREAFRCADWRLLAWKSMRQANGKWDEQSGEEVPRAGPSVPVDLGGATLTAHGCGHQPGRSPYLIFQEFYSPAPCAITPHPLH